MREKKNTGDFKKNINPKITANFQKKAKNK